MTARPAITCLGAFFRHVVPGRPLPRAGREALARYADDWDREGTPVWYSTWLPLLGRLRARLSELLGAPEDSLALAPSVSVALTTLASCIPRDPAAGRW